MIELSLNSVNNLIAFGMPKKSLLNVHVEVQCTCYKTETAYHGTCTCSYIYNECTLYMYM